MEKCYAFKTETYKTPFNGFYVDIVEDYHISQDGIKEFVYCAYLFHENNDIKQLISCEPRIAYKSKKDFIDTVEKELSSRNRIRNYNTLFSL